MEKKARILVVDDEDWSLRLMEGLLLPLRYEVILARDGEEALQKVQESPPDLVLLDIMMPRLNGFEVAKRLKKDEHTKIIPVVMVTALKDVEDRVKALEAGADDFLTKPVDKTELEARVQSLLRVKAYQAAQREILEKTLSGSVSILTEVLSLVNPAAFGRASRLRRITTKLIAQLGVESSWKYEVAAMLSQVGCVVMPPEVVEKKYRNEPLTPEETRLFKSHPQIGHDLIAKIPRLQEVAEIIAYQEKHYNGQGTPRDDRRGKAIPLGARILHVALALDALLSADQSMNKALEELNQRPGCYGSGCNQCSCSHRKTGSRASNSLDQPGSTGREHDPSRGCADADWCTGGWKGTGSYAIIDGALEKLRRQGEYPGYGSSQSPKMSRIASEDF
jgi:response regulator RpfG family c-di-GMP phosphodiesterase